MSSWEAGGQEGEGWGGGGRLGGRKGKGGGGGGRLGGRKGKGGGGGGWASERGAGVRREVESGSEGRGPRVVQFFSKS